MKHTALAAILVAASISCSAISSVRLEEVPYEIGIRIPIARADFPGTIFHRALPLTPLSHHYATYYPIEKKPKAKRQRRAFARARTEVDKIIEKYTSNYSLMRAIAWCESGLDPTEEGPTDDHGLFQIIPKTWRTFRCRGNPYNAVENTKCAEQIAQDSLKHWSATRSCWSNIGQANAEADEAMGRG